MHGNALYDSVEHVFLLPEPPKITKKMVKKSQKSKKIAAFLSRHKNIYLLRFYSLNRRQVRICTRTLPSTLKYAVKHCVKNHFIFFTIKKK